MRRGTSTSKTRRSFSIQASPCKLFEVPFLATATLSDQIDRTRWQATSLSLSESGPACVDSCSEEG